jgi:hypothetical protein
MNRRVLLAGVGTSLVATAAGCLGESTDENGAPTEADDGTPGTDCSESIEISDDDSLERFIKVNEAPESAGARKLLAAVENGTDGLMYYKGSLDTGRLGFNDAGETWELRYRGAPHVDEERFREEIAELATTFASNRPDGVSLTATSLHECTTGTWHVCAETAAAYESGELDRESFVDSVHETAEFVNDC